MFFNFLAAIAALNAAAGGSFALRLANAARNAASYLLVTLLPERDMPTYHVSSGSMTVRSTMAGLVGMDSHYPPGGLIDVSTFLEQTAKIAIHVPLSEQSIRTMQDFVLRMGLTADATNEYVQRQLLNFTDKILLQPQLDRAEWMRGQVLCFGILDWTFIDKRVLVDYGVPAANKLAARAGADGYGGATSKFWEDVVLLRRRLKNNVRAYLAHGDTTAMIRYNPANNLVPINEVQNGDGVTTTTFRRIIPATGQFTADAGDQVTIVSYDREGEIINPADPKTTIVVPFMERGKLVAVGNNTGSRFVIGAGSTDNPNDENALGYTHLAPTVENGGRPGRWSDVYVPQNEPWSVHGRSASNLLPVIEAPDKIAIATTAMV